MSDKTLYTAILSKGQDEALAILNEAKIQVENIQKENQAKIKNQREQSLKALNAEDEEIRRTQLASYDLAGRQAQLKARKILLEDVQAEALKSLKALEGDALKDFVIAVIKKSSAKGNEVLRTSQEDYKNYSQIFGSDLSVLNSALGTHFTLGNPTSIDGGFILEGQAFDIDASYEVLIKEICEAKEQDISALLFSTEA